MSLADRYRGLTDHLRTRTEPIVELSFAEIDRMVDGLPASAKKHAAWWANSRASQPHAWAWLDADRRAKPDLNAGRVRFFGGASTARGTTSDGQGHEPAPVPRDAGTSPIAAGGAQWQWEGNVQAAVVRHLAAAGWDIMRVADTSSREHGVDIDARKGGDRLIIEVKGFPANQSPTQARSYFGSAVLSGLLMRNDHADARVVLAFPSVTTFQNLARRTAGPLRSAGVELWLVGETGAIQVPGSS